MAYTIYGIFGNLGTVMSASPASNRFAGPTEPFDAWL